MLNDDSTCGAIKIDKQALTTADKTGYLLVLNITLYHLSNQILPSPVIAFASVLFTGILFISSKFFSHLDNSCKKGLKLG